MQFFCLVERFWSKVCAVYGEKVLRYSFALIYVWYGVLKILGKSPITDVVNLSTPFIPLQNFSFVLGFWEMLIGVLFFNQKYLKFGLILFFLKIPGTFLPLIFVPDLCFNQIPFEPTLIGQYIFKNFILIGSAMVLYTKTVKLT